MADYFSKVTGVHMGSQRKRDNLNFFHRPYKAFLISQSKHRRLRPKFSLKSPNGRFLKTSQERSQFLVDLLKF